MSDQNQTITPRQALNEVIAACTRASYAWGQQEATVACLRVLEGLVIEAEKPKSVEPKSEVSK